MQFHQDSASSMEAGKAKYGAAIRPSQKTPDKKPLNLKVVLGCVVVPLVIFIVTYFIMSFSLRYWANIAAHAVAIIMLLCALGLGGLAVLGTGEPRWLGLMCVLSVVGWLWAFGAANDNFQINMQPYNDLQQLTVYKDVDPSKDLGNQFMDFGILGFVKHTELDPKLSMAFKNRDTYCVAPVKVKGTQPHTYDFWAVGTNCCSSHDFHKYHDFQCGGWNNPQARSGVRVMRESQRAFYQLAANQAAAAYDIPVGANPVFFEWVADPAASVNALQDDGMNNFVWAIFNFFCIDLGVVVIALIVFSKL